LASTGQKALVPVHCSATSQRPLDWRQVMLVERKEFVGQFPEVPVQFSGWSQRPADARQAVLVER